MGSRRILLLLGFVFLQIFFIGAQDDYTILKAIKGSWKFVPPNWVGSNPCLWNGIACTKSRVTSISLGSMGLVGELSGDIVNLSELRILDLSYNIGMTGSLPTNIGNLKKLESLILLKCGFSGLIPDSIGSLEKLSTLDFNSNGFSGPIPHSIGNLLNLYWLDLATNSLDGELPVSNGASPGLDLLINTKHFHFGDNLLSGPIPEKLFSINMTLIHVLFDNNRFNGSIPASLGLVKTLEVVRLDRNTLSGNIPSNLTNLSGLRELYLSNNKLSGPLPDLTGMASIRTLDLSNNTLDTSTVPTWIVKLKTITTLRMEKNSLGGQIPPDLFGLPQLETVDLKHNGFNGSLDITEYSKALELIDLQDNSITGFPGEKKNYSFDVILVDNPVCGSKTTTSAYCSIPQLKSYSTPPENNCVPDQCNTDQISSPTCRCAYPYTGTLIFRSPSFSALGNESYYKQLETSMKNNFSSYHLPVDSLSLSNPIRNGTDFKLQVILKIFPSSQNNFNRTGISSLAFVLSNQTYKPPSMFGPFFFNADKYLHFTDEKSSNKSNVGVIIGVVVAGSILVLLLILAGLYAYRQKKRANRATEQSNPFAQWNSTKSSVGAPQLKGARSFSFEELKKSTNNFSDSNDVGSGGYGKVYRGILPTGELIAIKRAQQGSLQGGLEFKTEIELLSRVHHKNVVSLLGFCFERGEQMLIYEFVPNGSLKDSLSGKTGIRLDWARRLKISLGSARGLAYLHELANPPIIHRDIKSTNILLDDHLTAKVADFGLSKLMGDPDKGHVTTQVKGTMGYLDPEYYMTQQLTEKSDVYSFGITLMEIFTARSPIERGKYIVREIKMIMDKTKSLYNLNDILDPVIRSTNLKGLEKFVDLAMSCVEESGAARPTMGEVVKEIENIMKFAGMNPNAESASSSTTYEYVSKEDPIHPYSDKSFDYSGTFPPAKLEPQ